MNEKVARIRMNCGAPLHSNKCEYCGTEYGEAPFKADFPHQNYFGEIKINGETFKCYISDIKFHNTSLMESDRDIYGNLLKNDIVTKREFTLMEA